MTYLKLAMAMFGVVAIVFVVDTSMSLVMGYWQNAIFNSGFALAACLPLYLAWSQTKTAAAGPSAS